MKRVIELFALVWFAFAHGANAQNAIEMSRVHLSEAAVVNHQALPAGDYTIHLIETSSAIPVLSIVSEEGVRVTVVANRVPSIENTGTPTGVMLVREAGQLRLDTVWLGNAGYRIIAAK